MAKLPIAESLVAPGRVHTLQDRLLLPKLNGSVTDEALKAEGVFDGTEDDIITSGNLRKAASAFGYFQNMFPVAPLLFARIIVFCVQPKFGQSSFVCALNFLRVELVEGLCIPERASTVGSILFLLEKTEYFKSV
jgi:hypothetical protein